MVFGLATKIIDEISDWPDPPTATLIGLGEPLLNPDYFKIIEYAVSKSIQCGSSTNGMLLNRKFAEQIANSGLKSINISIDAFTEKTFLKIRPGANLALIKNNLVELLNFRDKYNKGPLINVVFVECDENRHETDAFVSYWKHIVDSVIIKPLSNFHGLNDKDSSLSWYRTKRKEKNICDAPFRSVRVSWDGFLTPCFYDCNNECTAGHIKKNTILNVFRGDIFSSVRKAFIGGNLIDLGRLGLKCRSCSYRFQESQRLVRYESINS